MLSFFVLSACASCRKAEESNETMNVSTRPSSETDTTTTSDVPILLYMGQASIRITTEEGRIIYIDPYAGDSYDLAADLILVTHEHFVPLWCYLYKPNEQFEQFSCGSGNNPIIIFI